MATKVSKQTTSEQVFVRPGTLLRDIASQMQVSTFKAPAVQQGKAAMLPTFGSVLGGTCRAPAVAKRAAVRVQRQSAVG